MQAFLIELQTYVSMLDSGPEYVCICICSVFVIKYKRWKEADQAPKFMERNLPQVEENAVNTCSVNTFHPFHKYFVALITKKSSINKFIINSNN